MFNFEHDPSIYTSSQIALIDNFASSLSKINLSSNVDRDTFTRFNSITKMKKKNEDSKPNESKYSVYGISNNSFINDLLISNKLCELTSHPDENIFSTNATSIPSSFRPMSSNLCQVKGSILTCPKIDTKSSTTNNSPIGHRSDLSSNQHSIESDIECSEYKPNEIQTCKNILDPSGVVNDYEALESNTASGSLANLSNTTNFSDILSETFSEKKQLMNQHKIIEILQVQRLNNNELVLKNGKIAQELEMRLKERRDMMDSRRPHIYQNSIYVECKNDSIEVKNMNESCGNLSYNYNKYNENCQRKHQNVKREFCDEIDANQVVFSLPRINVCSTSAPGKRDSIRMLMENKAVSENKQRDALEMHLNTILFSRSNLYSSSCSSTT